MKNSDDIPTWASWFSLCIDSLPSCLPSIPSHRGSLNNLLNALLTLQGRPIHSHIGGLQQAMGASKHLGVSESEKVRPKLWAGKLSIGNQKDIDIGSQVLCRAATMEEKRLKTRDTHRWAERFSFRVASWFGSRNGGRRTDNSLQKNAKCLKTFKFNNG